MSCLLLNEKQSKTHVKPHKSSCKPKRASRELSWIFLESHPLLFSSFSQGPRHSYKVDPWCLDLRHTSLGTDVCQCQCLRSQMSAACAQPGFLENKHGTLVCNSCSQKISVGPIDSLHQTWLL